MKIPIYQDVWDVWMDNEAEHSKNVQLGPIQG
jgi:hypothetical protein